MTTTKVPSGGSRQCEETMSGFVLKPHSTPATLLWLQANYEAVEGVCIPRNAMYNQYVEFCRTHGMMPVNAASFGKIIRQKFPGLTTRRLGTRGQSRYHYYGLAVKSDASLYAQSSFLRYGANEPNYDPAVCGSQKPSSRFVANPLLSLPSSDILRGLPKSVPEAAASTLHIMYTLHCQQLIDYCIHFQFKEVKEYIGHFWSGFPPHLAPLLENNSILSLIGLCDAITYRAVSHIIMPCIMLEEVPTRRAEDSIRLAECMVDWLVQSLSNTPVILRRVKLHAARTLLHTVRRQVSLNHLCSNVRLVLTSEIHLQQMFSDWEHLDMQVVVDEILFSVGTSESGYASHIIASCCKELEKILRGRPQLTSLGNWVKNLVERCVTRQIENSRSSGERLRNFACNFLLIWSSVGTRILREMTLLGAHSFGTFHLLYLMLTEYGAQLVESLIVEDQIHRLTANVALGNPLDSSDFEAGILCDAQCPCKSMYPPGTSKVVDGMGHSHVPVETAASDLGQYHGSSASNTDLEYTHHSEQSLDVKIMSPEMPSAPSHEFFDVGGGGRSGGEESELYYSANHGHGRSSCSFSDVSSEHHPSVNNICRMNHGGRGEYLVYVTPSEAPFPESQSTQPFPLASGPATSEHSGSGYCIMDSTSESNPNNNGWYMVSSYMSGGECYDSFCAPEPSTSHHSTVAYMQQSPSNPY